MIVNDCWMKFYYLWMMAEAGSPKGVLSIISTCLSQPSDLVLCSKSSLNWCIVSLQPIICNNFNKYSTTSDIRPSTFCSYFSHLVWKVATLFGKTGWFETRHECDCASRSSKKRILLSWLSFVIYRMRRFSCIFKNQLSLSCWEGFHYKRKTF